MKPRLSSAKVASPVPLTRPRSDRLQFESARRLDNRRATLCRAGDDSSPSTSTPPPRSSSPRASSPSSSVSLVDQIRAANHQAQFLQLSGSMDQMTEEERLLYLERICTTFGPRPDVERANVQKILARCAESLLERRSTSSKNAVKQSPKDKQKEKAKEKDGRAPSAIPPNPLVASAVLRSLSLFAFVEPIRLSRIPWLLEHHITPFLAPDGLAPPPLSDLQVILRDATFHTPGNCRLALHSLLTSGALFPRSSRPVGVDTLLTLLEGVGERNDGTAYVLNTWLPVLERLQQERSLSCRALVRVFRLLRAHNAPSALARPFLDPLVQSVVALATVPAPPLTSSDVLSSLALGDLPDPEDIPSTQELVAVITGLAHWHQWALLAALLPAFRDVLALGIAGSTGLDPRESLALSGIHDQVTVWGEVRSSTPSPVAPSPTPSSPPKRSNGRGGSASAGAAESDANTAAVVLPSVDPTFWVPLLVTASEGVVSKSDASTLEQVVEVLERLARVDSELSAGPSTSPSPAMAAATPSLPLVQVDQLRFELRTAASAVVLRMGGRRELLSQPPLGSQLLRFLVCCSRLGVDMTSEVQRASLEGLSRGRRSLSKFTAAEVLSLLESLTLLSPELTAQHAVENVVNRLRALSPQLAPQEALYSALLLAKLGTVTARGRLNATQWFWFTWEAVVASLRKMRSEDADREGHVYRAALYITCCLGSEADAEGYVRKALAEIPRKWLVTSTGQWLARLQRMQARELDAVESEVYQDILALCESESKGEWRCKDRTLAAGDIALSPISVWKKGANKQVSLSVGRPEDYLVRAKPAGSSKPASLRLSPDALARDAVLEENGWVSVRVPVREWAIVRLQDPGKRRAYLKQMIAEGLSGSSQWSLVQQQQASASSGGTARSPGSKGGASTGISNGTSAAGGNSGGSDSESDRDKTPFARSAGPASQGGSSTTRGSGRDSPLRN